MEVTSHSLTALHECAARALSSALSAGVQGSVSDRNVQEPGVCLPACSPLGYQIEPAPWFQTHFIATRYPDASVTWCSPKTVLIPRLPEEQNQDRVLQVFHWASLALCSGSAHGMPGGGHAGYSDSCVNMKPGAPWAG